MNTEKMSVYISFVTIFFGFSATFASEILNCSPPSLSIGTGKNRQVDNKPTLYFLYDRNSLLVSQYHNQSANLYLSKSGIRVKVSDDIDDSIVTEKSYITEVFGIAKIVTTNYGSKELGECKFFILDKPTNRLYDNLPINFDSKIFEITEECLTSRLCKTLGVVRQSDVSRARLNPLNFEMMSTRLQNRNFKINPSQKLSVRDAADFIIQKVVEEFQKKNNGRIAIPNIYRRVFTATGGTFEGLVNLQRYKGYNIRKSAPNENPRSFAFTFGIPLGHVSYSNYGLFKLVPLVGQLCADVSDLTFSAEIALDPGAEDCRPSLVNFQTNNPGSSSSRTCGDFSWLTSPVLSCFLDAWDYNVVGSIAWQIEWTMTAIVYENLSCQNLS